MIDIKCPAPGCDRWYTTDNDVEISEGMRLHAQCPDGHRFVVTFQIDVFRNEDATED